MNRYSITRNSVLIDSEPMSAGKSFLIWDAQAKEWTQSKGMLVGEYTDSIPVSDEEAAHFCQTGEMPARVKKAIETDTGYYPEPWDD